MIEIFAVLVAVVGVYIGYLQLQHQRKHITFKNDPVLPHASVDHDTKYPNAQKQPPESVDFEPGKEIWSPPTPSALGIPAPLSYVFSISTPLKQGDIVRRGEPLIIFEFTAFKGIHAKGALKYFLPERLDRLQFVFHAPVSGLVLGFEKIPARKSGGLYRGMIDKRGGEYPLLLIAKGETAWDTLEVERIQDELFRVLRERWRNNWHMCAIKNEDHPEPLADAVSDGSFWKIGMMTSSREDAKERERSGMLFLNSADLPDKLPEYSLRPVREIDVPYLREICHHSPKLATYLNPLIEERKRA